MKPIFLLGEAPGELEVRLGRPFVGPSGIELIRMLGESGLITLTTFDRDYIHRYYTTNDPSAIAAIWDLHPEVYRTNVFSTHPPRNDIEYFCGPRAEGIPGFPALLKSKYVREEFEHELDRLADDLLRRDPNLVICLGNSAIWALAGRTGITKLRGTTLLSTHTAADFKLLPTYHPSAVLRQWELRPTVIADFMKAARESAYPELRRPPVKSGSNHPLTTSDNSSTPTSEDVLSFLSILRQADHVLLALDLLLPHQLQSLFLLMTSDQKMEAIGRLGRMKINAGVLCDEFLGIDLSLSSSKMVRTILHSSGAPTESQP